MVREDLAGIASRNSSVASMKPNDSGVAKWSTLRSTFNVASGNAAASGSPGPAKSLSPITTSVEQVAPATSSAVNRTPRGRFMTAVRAARSLSGWLPYWEKSRAMLSSGGDRKSVV